MPVNAIRDALLELLKKDRILDERRTTALQELADIDAEKRRIGQAVASLAAVEGKTSALPENVQLADALRILLASEYPRYLTVPEIRDRLLMMSYDDSEHTNLLASIHSVIARFKEASTVESVTNAEGTKHKFRLSLASGPPPMPMSKLVRESQMRRDALMEALKKDK